MPHHVLTHQCCCCCCLVIEHRPHHLRWKRRWHWNLQGRNAPHLSRIVHKPIHTITHHSHPWRTTRTRASCCGLLEPLHHHCPVQVVQLLLVLGLGHRRVCGQECGVLPLAQRRGDLLLLLLRHHGCLCDRCSRHRVAHRGSNRYTC